MICYGAGQYHCLYAWVSPFIPRTECSFSLQMGSCGYGIWIDSIGPILPSQCCFRWQLHRRVHTLNHSPYLHSSLRFHILTNVLVGSVRLSRQDTYWKCFIFFADKQSIHIPPKSITSPPISYLKFSRRGMELSSSHRVQCVDAWIIACCVEDAHLTTLCTCSPFQSLGESYPFSCVTPLQLHFPLPTFVWSTAIVYRQFMTACQVWRITPGGWLWLFAAVELGHPTSWLLSYAEKPLHHLELFHKNSLCLFFCHTDVFGTENVVGKGSGWIRPQQFWPGQLCSWPLRQGLLIKCHSAFQFH